MKWETDTALPLHLPRDRLEASLPRATVVGEQYRDWIFVSHNLLSVCLKYCGYKVAPVPAAVPFRVSFP